MDELKMVGDILAPERPASRQVTARARERLLDEAATGNRRARSPRSASPRSASPRSARTWMVLGLVSAATAALALVPTLLLGGDRSVQAPPGVRPEKQNKALNVLVVGSDRRIGASGARADTMVLLHLSADRKRVRGVSLPRDLMVAIPGCKSRSGAVQPAHLGMLGTAFTTGGTACVWKAVESATGVRVDHAMTIDYAGFKSMVYALGGVEIKLPRAVNDSYSGLRQPAGVRVVGGDQALAYVRARRGMGDDGSDLARVENQQRFMAAMLARAGERLSDPVRLYTFLQAVDKFTDHDAELGLKTMYDIARSVKATGPGGAEFVTVPWRPYRPDPSRIELNRGAAERLFAELRSDAP